MRAAPSIGEELHDEVPEQRHVVAPRDAGEVAYLSGRACIYRSDRGLDLGSSIDLGFGAVRRGRHGKGGRGKKCSTLSEALMPARLGARAYTCAP